MANCLGIPFIIAGIISGVISFLALLTRRNAIGRVVDMYSHTDHGTTYTPIVEFQDESGRLVKFRTKIGFSIVPRVGSLVPVLYARWNSNRARIGNFQYLFLLPLIFIAVGIFLIAYDYKSFLLGLDWIARFIGNFI